MSVVLLLLFVGALYTMEHFRSQREVVQAELLPRATGAQAPRIIDVPGIPLKAQQERPGGLERRHGERRRIDRRHAA